MELLNQPLTGQLGNRLIDWLDSGEYHTLNILVAFAKTSGVLRLKDALERFRNRGGTVNIHVGVDLEGTSYEALASLLLNSDSLVIVHAEKRQTFHPKIYCLLGEGENLLVVGSHNLTGGGLWTNFETSVIISVPSPTLSPAAFGSQLNKYTTSLASLNGSYMSINHLNDIDALLANGYVFKEVDEQVRLANAARTAGPRKRLFGNGAPAGIPQLAPPKTNKPIKSGVPGTAPAVPANPLPVLQSEDWQTIWFETRSMTGGSRNILDLSVKSLVSRGDPSGTPFDLGDPKYMRGSVSFFGMDPSATDQAKDVVLNFEGLDYVGNTILFPSGARANGTWRMQIKGVAASGRKITDAFRQKGSGYYLTDKIVAFKKIDADYFVLSVFPDGEIRRFETASKILGNNGATRTAKRVGLL